MGVGAPAGDTAGRGGAETEAWERVGPTARSGEPPHPANATTSANTRSVATRGFRMAGDTGSSDPPPHEFLRISGNRRPDREARHHVLLHRPLRERGDAVLAEAERDGKSSSQRNAHRG